MTSPRYHILIVDDEASLRDFLTAFLSDKGHACLSACHGEDALQKAKEKKFDAIITDICMPGMDGIELTRELKTFLDAPIMVITGYYEMFTAEKAMAAGAADFVTKPFTLGDFHLRFQRMMREHEQKIRAVKEHEALQRSGGEMIKGIQDEASNKIKVLEEELNALKQKKDSSE